MAGERRLRAARIAGLREVPCLVAQVGEEDSALLALMENLQRRDLDCWEEAQAIARLISRYGLSQEEAARRLGRAQPTVANKLRLLRLPEDVRALLRENGLTERHAWALLRLQDPEVQRRAAGDMVRREDERGPGGGPCGKAPAIGPGHPAPGPEHLHHQDVRLFLNSVDRGLHLMRQAGVDAGWNRQDTDRGDSADHPASPSAPQEKSTACPKVADCYRIVTFSRDVVYCINCELLQLYRNEEGIHEQTNQKPLTERKSPSLGRTAGLIAGIAVGVLAAAYIAVLRGGRRRRDHPASTQVLGVDVGGLTASVRDKWQREGDAACRKRPST